MFAHKYYLILFALFLETGLLSAQNDCYVQLDEASGFDVSPYQADLDAKACELKAAFQDTAFSNHFKVYGFGFYLNLDYYDGYSYPQAFQDLQEEVAALSPYYLLIGRQSDRTGIFTKFWIKVKLPNTGNFECLDEYERLALDFFIRDALDLAYKGRGKDPNTFAEVEVAGMDSLITYVEKQILCCEPQNRVACDLCISSYQIKAVVESLGFFMIDGGVLQDSISGPPAPDVDDYSYSIVDVDGQLQKMLEYIQSKGNSSHEFITVDDSFCNSDFQSAQEEFDGISRSQNDYKVWWHIWKNPENNEFIVFEKISNYEEFLDEFIISLLGEEYWGTPFPGQDCHETLRGYNIGVPSNNAEDWEEYTFEGNVAHRIIESYYKEVTHKNESVAIEYAIPNSGKTGGIGYADIVNLTYGAIYEIKKFGYENQARIEANKYVQKANLYCPQPQWYSDYIVGPEEPFPSIFPFPNNRQLKAYWHQPGVIIYIIKDDLVPDPQYSPLPNFLPQKVFDKLKDLLELLAQGAGNTEKVIADFLRENPKLTEFIVQYAGGIIITVVVVNLIEDLATGGVGVWNDVFIFTSLFRIVSIAKSIPPVILVKVP